MPYALLLMSLVVNTFKRHIPHNEKKMEEVVWERVCRTNVIFANVCVEFTWLKQIDWVKFWKIQEMNVGQRLLLCSIRTEHKFLKDEYKFVSNFLIHFYYMTHLRTSTKSVFDLFL